MKMCFFQRGRILGVSYIIVFLFLTFPAFSQSFSQTASNRVTSGQVAKAKSIANHFSAIKTMTGDFIQFSPKGDVTEGTFYLERPGKIRFSYKGVPLQIIADGEFVGVNNRALNSWNFSLLAQTPVKILLDDKIDLSSGRLAEFSEVPGAITMVLRDKSIGRGQIKIIFDSKNYALRQWTVVDEQNLQTTVQIMNVRTGVQFADGMFTLPYNKMATVRDRNSN